MSPARIASTRCFYGSVERQKISLVGDIADNIEYLTYAFGLLTKKAHVFFHFVRLRLHLHNCGYNAIYNGRSARCLSERIFGSLCGISRVFCHLNNSHAHLLHGGSGIFKAFCLSLRAIG